MLRNSWPIRVVWRGIFFSFEGLVTKTLKLVWIYAMIAAIGKEAEQTKQFIRETCRLEVH